MAMHVTGPMFSSQGNFITVPLPKALGTHAAASGTIVTQWRAVLPPFAFWLNAIGLSFAAASLPQGGSFGVKVWSNGARKGVTSASVAGGTTPAVLFGNLAFTFPASAAVRLTVNTVGGTAAGGGGQPTLYLRHQG